MVLPNILFINEIKDEPFDVEEEEDPENSQHLEDVQEDTENNQYVEDVEGEEERENSHQHLEQILGLHESEDKPGLVFTARVNAMDRRSRFRRIALLYLRSCP
ncbi:hypothetical protein Anas_11507 [Armadillidium nasatum]|uniref:Uncharacterized protein n=1 Tax=Armadillidium nasatum TaxID=96803 RepID=A0A5N5SVF1_9CRUS|nr:hypothetical protein Anas_11507 [Armadillidium nasatum]